MKWFDKKFHDFSFRSVVSKVEEGPLGNNAITWKKIYIVMLRNLDVIANNHQVLSSSRLCVKLLCPALLYDDDDDSPAPPAPNGSNIAFNIHDCGIY